MKTIKRPYTPVCDLELVPVECISDFAVILPRAFIAVRDGSYRIPVIPGSFTPESNPSRRTQELYIIM